MSPVTIIFLTLLCSAFFSGIEIAFITASKLRIELKNKQGSYSAAILSRFVKNPTRFIGTTLIGNNISLVIYSIFMEEMLRPIFFEIIPDPVQHPYLILALATILSTIIVLVIAEFLPKVLFRVNPDFLLDFFAIPFLLSYYILYPIVHSVTYISNFLIRLFFRSTITDNTPVFSKVDLDNYINESAHTDLDEDADVNTEIFKNALDFGNVKLRNCMIPRTELVAIDLNEGVEALYNLFIESGHSKLLIYRDNIDNIIGYVHQVDMFKKPVSIQSVLIPIIIANETLSAHELLKQFTKNHKSMALVVDEFGGTAGIVTIEDILEMIFGEIDDEYDKEELTEQVIDENEYLFSARLEISYLNDTYPLNIPEGDYETLGGFILANHESLPKQGEVIQITPFEFTITSAGKTRINEVKMRTGIEAE